MDVIGADDMDQASPGNGEKISSMDSRKRAPHPKLSELKGASITLSGEDDSLVGESTQSLLEFAATKGYNMSTVTNMKKTELADFLRDFYTKVKIKNDDTITLKDLRTGLHKFFLDEVGVDILHDHSFESANATFDLAVRANPRKSHRIRIEMDDLKKIYLSDAMDTNKPDTLQNKVFFDVSLYICNKGKDFFRSMKKTDFVVTTDIYGRRYVSLKDSTAPREEELPVKLKLKRSVDEGSPTSKVGERMYERPGDPRCPLSSFLKYTEHLHPMRDAFWQRPKRSVSQSDYVWYDHAPLGSSNLTKIMQRISLQAGLSDNYTNYSICSALIPLVEAVCEKAMQAVNTGAPPTNLPLSQDVKPTAADELSCDDRVSQNSEVQVNHKEQDKRGPATTTAREKPPMMSTASFGSGSLDLDDGDLLGLMQAKTQVLNLIRGLMVKDIQKFVDWLKTVRVQYSDGELIVLCSPVDKSNVEPIPDEAAAVERNGCASHLNCHSHHPFKTSGSLDLSEKRFHVRNSPLKNPGCFGDKFENGGGSVKQVEFSSLSGVYCSSEDLGPMKISIPSSDTVLVTGVPEDVQIMLHKRGSSLNSQESLPERVFCSENEMDLAEVVASLSNARSRQQQQSNNSSSSHSNYLTVSEPQLNHHHQHNHHLTILQHHASPVMVTIPAAHSKLVSTLTARERFKDSRNKSLGCLDPPPSMSQGAILKRVSSTGTPILKRQANVDPGMFPENLTVKRFRDEVQATNLSLKPIKKEDLAEAKRAATDRLEDSLRFHQEILQNSPLIKRPGERNLSGFRHCYANTVSNHMKPEALDSSYG